MDTMGIHPQAAKAILSEELDAHRQARFRLAMRLRNSQKELERLDQIIAEYEQEVSAL